MSTQTRTGGGGGRSHNKKSHQQASEKGGSGNQNNNNDTNSSASGNKNKTDHVKTDKEKIQQKVILSIHCSLFHKLIGFYC